MGMLADAGMQLLKSVLALIQVAVASVLLTYIWVPIAIVVGLLNLVYFLIYGESFENIDLLIEPLRWYLHQIGVIFAVREQFWAIPYRGM